MFHPLSRLMPGRDQKQPPAKSTLKTMPVLLRSEVNGLVFPYFFLSKGQDPGAIEYRVIRRQNGETYEGVWRVTPHQEYGRAGPFAHRVHRAVEQLITERGHPVTNPIQFSIHDLCRRMGTHAGGTEYHNIKAAMVAIKATQIESSGMFYSKALSRRIDQVFSLYDRIIFVGEQLPDGTIAEKNLLYLNSWYLESLNSRYVRPLDYHYYLRLDTPIARRLYELLGVKFYKLIDAPEPRIRYRYSTLCQLLPIRRHRYLSRVHQQLDPAHERLLQSGFLGAAEAAPIPQKRDWYITYRPGPRARKEIRENRTKAKDQTKCKKFGGHSSGLHGGRRGQG